MRPRQAERHHVLQRALHWRWRKQRQCVDRHRAVMLSAVHGVLERAILAHQANCMLEITVTDLAPLQRLNPECARTVIPAAESEHDREGDLALAEIVADVLAEFC